MTVLPFVHEAWSVEDAVHLSYSKYTAAASTVPSLISTTSVGIPCWRKYVGTVPMPRPIWSALFNVRSKKRELCMIANPGYTAWSFNWGSSYCAPIIDRFDRRKSIPTVVVEYRNIPWTTLSRVDPSCAFASLCTILQKDFRRKQLKT